MTEYDHLLTLAKNAAQEAVITLEKIGAAGLSSYKFADDIPREVKATADRVIEEIILGYLRPTELPILSEEAGNLQGTADSELRWVVDPLDGTVNFVRGLAPCAVSIALYHGNFPIFGVIGEYPSCRLAWGGQIFGAFIEGNPIHVSTIHDKSKAILCTGFPSRFDFDGAPILAFMELISSFNKVRMLGAASLSLLHVARGAADAYAEQDIMLWDVAAGLALIEGAGGRTSVAPGRYHHSFNIFASNGLL